MSDVPKENLKKRILKGIGGMSSEPVSHDRKSVSYVESSHVNIVSKR